MGYRIRRVDSNQKRVVSQFRLLRCKVCILSEVGRGVPDLIVSIPINHSAIDQRWWMVWVEIKDGSKPLSARQLTADEKKFHDFWKGMVFIVESEQDVINLVESVQADV